GPRHQDPGEGPRRDRPGEGVSPGGVGHAALRRVGLRDGGVRDRWLDPVQGGRDARLHRETEAGVDGRLNQYDSNSSCKSITTCSRTSSNEELRYSRIPPSSLWMRAMKLLELFRNSTFTRDSSIVIRSWGTVRRGVPFGRIRGPYLRVARTVPRTRARAREPHETDSRRRSPPKLYLAHTLWSAPSN